MTEIDDKILEEIEMAVLNDQECQKLLGYDGPVIFPISGNLLLSLCAEVRRLWEDNEYLRNEQYDGANRCPSVNLARRERAEAAEARVKELENQLEQVREIWEGQRRDLHGGRYFYNHQEESMERAISNHKRPVEG